MTSRLNARLAAARTGQRRAGLGRDGGGGKRGRGQREISCLPVMVGGVGIGRWQIKETKKIIFYSERKKGEPWCSIPSRIRIAGTRGAVGVSNRSQSQACVKLTETRAWAVWWPRPIDNVTAARDPIHHDPGRRSARGAPGT